MMFECVYMVLIHLRDDIRDGNIPILVKCFIASVHIEQANFVDWEAVVNVRHRRFDRNERSAFASLAYKANQHCWGCTTIRINK